ncbi:hypothetical protein EDB84DRAFT_1561112 [Lactarius hengduanensis]|nr:hypothetical protein EDB84DRAFT_1561112 [Lactarius hengduanensis]
MARFVDAERSLPRTRWRFMFVIPPDATDSCPPSRPAHRGRSQGLGLPKHLASLILRGIDQEMMAALSDIRSLFNAVLKEYEKQVATNLLDNRLTIKLQSCDSADDICALTGVPNVSRPTPSPDEDVGLPFPPAKAIFAGIGTFPLPIRIYRKLPETHTEIIVKILVELLSTLVFATQHVKQGRLRENETDVVLQRLDRLNHEEAQTIAAQTLEVVYRLVKDMKVVMDA